jgi:hypothetical protein
VVKSTLALRGVNADAGFALKSRMKLSRGGSGAWDVDVCVP